MSEIYIDLDGPILDVKRRHYLVYKQILNVLHTRPLLESRYWKYKRRKESLKNIFKKSLLDNKIDIFKKRWQDLIEKKEYLKMDGIFPDTRRLLSKLNKKHKLILVSLRKSKSNLIWQLNYLNIIKYFDKILCKNSNKGAWRVKYNLLKKEKPSADSYIIGDTEIDILAGKKLGMKTVALSCGIRNKDFLNKFKPDYLLNNLKEVATILK